MQKTHVLGTAYRKTVHAEVTDHFRYTVERLAELAQDVRVQLLVLLDTHVHEATGASANSSQKCAQSMKDALRSTVEATDHISSKQITCARYVGESTRLHICLDKMI